MKFINLDRQYSRIKSEIDSGIQTVINRGDFIMGEEVKLLEKELEKYLQVKNVICCSSGTDALLAALLSLDIKSGDYILTTPFTFIATSEVISLLGAKPIFVDIDARTFNIDYHSVEFKIKNSTKKFKAILAVDLFGQQCDYEELKRISNEYNIFLIQDAAQSFGSTYKGKNIGSYSDIATTSFFPSKPLGCYGDGGAIITNDDLIAEKLRSIIQHGKGTSKYDNIRIGFNGRLDTIQAAILLEKLKIFNNELGERNRVVNHYTNVLEKNKDILLPYLKNYCQSSWAQYSILLKNRDSLKIFLTKLGIPTNIYYPTPLHKLPVYNLDISLENSEWVSKNILSLPMCPYLKDYEIEFVSKSILSFCEV